MYHEDWISVLGTNRSQEKPYLGNEEGFQIHIQSQQSWQLVACGQGRCPARAEHRESVFLASFLRFPGEAASICMCNMHRLSCDFEQDNQSWSPPWLSQKIEAITFPAWWTVLNVLEGGEPGWFHCLHCIFDSGSKWLTYILSWSIKSLGSSS